MFSVFTRVLKPVHDTNSDSDAVCLCEVSFVELERS